MTTRRAAHLVYDPVWCLGPEDEYRALNTLAAAQGYLTMSDVTRKDAKARWKKVGAVARFATSSNVAPKPDEELLRQEDEERIAVRRSQFTDRE